MRDVVRVWWLLPLLCHRMRLRPSHHIRKRLPASEHADSSLRPGRAPCSSRHGVPSYPEWWGEESSYGKRLTPRAGRRVINLSGRIPDQLLTLVPSARTCDRRSTELGRAVSRPRNRSRPRGRRLLRPARGSGG